MTPNARNISDVLALKPASTPQILNTQGLNLVETFFGQFVNHDKEDTNSLFGPNDLLYKVPLPYNDPWYVTPDNGRNFVGVRDTQTNLVNGVRQVQSNATSFFDLSTIYGSDPIIAAALREYVGGRLLLSNYTTSGGPGTPVVTFTNMLPNSVQTNINIVPNIFPGVESQAWVSGDLRVNENIALAYIHWLFHLEHNRLASQVAAANPTWTDEQIFQKARRLNIAQYQNIIAHEYMPDILGEDLMELIPDYNGYKSNVDATTTIEFAAAAFRYGHSTVRSYPFLDPLGNSVPIVFPCGIFLDVFCLNIPAPGLTIITNGMPAAAQLGGLLTAPTMTYLAQMPQNIWRGLLNTRSEKVDSKIDK